MVVPETLDGFRDHVRAFIAREIAPNAERWTRERSVPRELHVAAGTAGLLGLKYASEWGGASRPYAFTHAMLDEFGRSGEMGCLLSLALQSEFATPHLALYGGEALQRRFLVPAIAGTCIVAIAMTETEGGSDLANLHTTATAVAGGYRVSGSKWMIGNGSLADAVLVVCRAADQLEGQLPRASLVLVEATTPGFSVVRRLEKTGLHATPNCELRFDDCVVPAEHVLGRPGLALPQGLVANTFERVALAILATGAMRAGWESAVRFLGSRGGERALLDRSPWRHRLTQDYVRIQGIERIVSAAAATLDGGKPDHALVLTAKIAATEACQEVLQHAAQAHGARGFLADELVGRLAADARALTTGGGATEALIEALSRIVLPPVLRAH
jgi:alkylation response protein AidB-like acyl-CoA dehydrogenase